MSILLTVVYIVDCGWILLSIVVYIADGGEGGGVAIVDSVVPTRCTLLQCNLMVS